MSIKIDPPRRDATFPEIVVALSPKPMPKDSEGRPHFEVGVGVTMFGSALMQSHLVSDSQCDCGWTTLPGPDTTDVVVRPLRGRRHYIRGLRLEVKDAPPGGVKLEVLYGGSQVMHGSAPVQMFHDAVLVDWPGPSFESPLVLRFTHEPVEDNTARPVVYLACAGFSPQILTACPPTEETQA